MKVTIEHMDLRITIQDNIEDAYDCLEMCLRAMIGATFHPKSVEKAIAAKAEEIALEEKE